MSVIFNGTEIEKLIFNGTELDTAFYQGVEVFTSAREVTYSLTNLNQVSCPTKVKNGGTLIAQISGASGFLTPETITVTMDGVELTTTTTESSYYTYDANTGTITVYNCVGAINIVATTDITYSTLWVFSGSSVTKYNGSDINLTIPYCYKAYTRNNTTYYSVSNETVTGYTNVTTIAASMFYGVTTLKSITLLTPLKTIGSEAFRGCTNLQTVTAPSGLTTINASAFYGCSSLTRAVTAGTYGNYAYYNCTALAQIGSTTSSISFSNVGDYAFYNCSKLVISGISFYKVGAYAFWNCNNITGTATESYSVSSGSSYTIGQFAFAKTNLTKFDLSKINSKAVSSWGSGCFSSNSKWDVTLNYSNTYSPIATLIHTSTSSSDGGTYKYIYGGYCGSGSGTIVSGDYVPYVEVHVFWDTWTDYWTCSNITSSGGSFSHFCLTISSSSSPGFSFYADCRNASTSTDTFKSAYANVRYYTMKEDPTSVSAKNESTYTETGSVTPTHGIAYWWYPYSYVTAQSSGCIAFDTPITLADGTTKLIQDVTYKDRILRVNHDTGEIDTSYCHWINRDETVDKYYKVTFSDGSMIKFISPHAMFSLDELRYVQITNPNEFHIGTRVPKQITENGQFKLSEVSVENIEIVFETIHFCEVVTGQFLNCFANNLLITEPFTTGFQNMYGFNEDLTYKSPIRKQYLAGEYKGYLFSEEYIRDTLRITNKDSIGFRAEEWGMLMEAGYIKEIEINEMIDEFVNSPRHKVDPFTDENGVNIWPVTNDNDIVENIDDYMMQEGSEYILPENDDANFIGWYCSADSKMYQPNDIYKVKYGTHFTAKFKQGE